MRKFHNLVKKDLIHKVAKLGVKSIISMGSGKGGDL